jgi:hypothetical protein
VRALRRSRRAGWFQIRATTRPRRLRRGAEREGLDVGRLARELQEPPLPEPALRAAHPRRRAPGELLERRARRPRVRPVAVALEQADEE